MYISRENKSQVKVTSSTQAPSQVVCLVCSSHNKETRKENVKRGASDDKNLGWGKLGM